MNTNQRNKRLHLGRRTLISAAAVLTVAGVGSQIYFAKNAKADEPKPMLMFVQLADDLKADPAAKTLRLVNVSKQTLYFSDRPVRLAGHVKMADYLEEWTKKGGSDNFGGDPPNATLSVYEPGQSDNTLAVVELTNPVIDGADLVYTYKLIDGKMPKGGGATSLFIDWIGLGGGVGRGFHGVGVGLRGPGVL
jgi:hypothetical protein